MRTDLSSELQSAAARVEQRHLDRLIALGISGGTIAEMGLRGPPFGMVRGVDVGAGLYEPGDGPECVVIPVHAEGTLIDLVAFRTDQPTRWRLRTGLGWALGADQIYVPSWDNEPLQLWRSPLDWLRNDGVGITVLDWDAPELRDLLMVESIAADNDVGNRLLDILARPTRLPKLIVRKAVRHAA
ncbi:hypothetical protein CAF53_08780 [Sphingobium sp. LB126]|uniref:hypothetical protein n=1 Tax=Sphingobium sp. LB126 TaxID=1983755 RepID=UPI000C20BFE8|nr:hypothetical protein [Sphingobium sp. LB126]PJG48323.1 hypothetical protein CAF53_08780 [Sphingobium sp. LB126]